MDVFDLQAALRLDKTEYDKGLDSARDSAGKFGSLVSSTLGTAAKVGVAAIAAAAAGVVALTSKAVSSYATYEQMVGGIETLFGAQGESLEGYAALVGKSVDVVKDKYNTLMEAQTLAMENADNAYKTAGMSANKYMETITGFAAALKQSTSDEVEAAKVADVAIQDMADNANKMGTSMTSIQDAYQGFAKQNYTMLDNLKLGYGGTKEEMERLLADAEKISGIKYDISNLSDVFNAVHVIQQELGITGTTAKEAMYTIEGSANMTKAAWENVIIAIGKGEGLTDAFSNLTTAIFGDESGGGLLNNVIPRIQTVMEGIGEFIASAAPLISEKLPELVDAVVPSLLSASGSLVMALVSAMPSILGSLWESVISAMGDLYSYISSEGPNMLSAASGLFENIISAIQEKAPSIIEAGQNMLSTLISLVQEYLPVVLSFGYDMISNLVSGFVEGIPEVLPKVLDFIQQIANGLAEAAPVLIQKGFELLSKLVEGIVSAIPILIEKVPTIISTFANIINDNFPTILSMGFQLIVQLISGIVQAIPTLIANIPQIISAIVDVIEAFNWIGLGTKIITLFKNGIIGMVGAVKSAGISVYNAIRSAIQNLPSTLMNIGRTAISGLGNAISSAIGFVVSAASSVASSIVSTLRSIPGSMISIGRNIVSGLWNGISGMVGWVLNKVKGFAGTILRGIKGVLGIHSPSTVVRDEVGKMIAMGLGIGMEDNTPVSQAVNMVKKVVKGAKSAMDNITVPITTELPYNSYTGGFTSSVGLVSGGDTSSSIVDIIDYEFTRLIGLLNQYFPQFANTKILMDTGTLVGEIVPEVDSKLGNTFGHKGRRN